MNTYSKRRTKNKICTLRVKVLFEPSSLVPNTVRAMVNPPYVKMARDC